MHVGIADPRWRGKRSRHSWRKHNPQFYVSDKRPIETRDGMVSAGGYKSKSLMWRWENTIEMPTIASLPMILTMQKHWRATVRMELFQSRERWWHWDLWTPVIHINVSQGFQKCSTAFGSVYIPSFRFSFFCFITRNSKRVTKHPFPFFYSSNKKRKIEIWSVIPIFFFSFARRKQDKR